MKIFSFLTDAIHYFRLKTMKESQMVHESRLCMYEDGVRKLSCEHTTPSCNLQVNSLINPRFL
jgi:hypothetical protein